MIRISIIVPVYNVEKYLENCLESLVNQTYNNYEIIIVDDGSTDGSDKIIKKYKTKYSNLIKSYKKENGGLSSARNYGINKSNGDYLLFVDSDDSLELNALEILNKNIKTNDILVFNMNIIKNNNKEKVCEFNPKIHNKIKRYLVSNPSACNKLIKKELFDNYKIVFKEGIYYEDLNLLPTFVNYTNNIEFIDIPLYNYYVRDNSITNNKEFNDKMDDIFNVLKNLYISLNDSYKDEVEYLYIEHLLRYASIRYMDYKKYDKIDTIINLMKDYHPNWYKNVYFKKYYSLKQKIMCHLIYRKKFNLINIFRKS